MTNGDEHRSAGTHDAAEDRKGQERATQSGADAAGALGAEAERLMDAFSEWVGQAGAEREAAEGGPGRSVGDDAEPSGADVPETSVACECGRTAGLDAVCRICPVCRVAAYVHTVRPEILERVADVLAMVAGSLQAIAADRSADPRPGRDTDDRRGSNAANATAEGVPIPVRGDEISSESGRH